MRIGNLRSLLVDIHEKWETGERERNLVSRLGVVDVACGMGDDAVEKWAHWCVASDFVRCIKRRRAGLGVVGM
jgi:hypothetical protein